MIQTLGMGKLAVVGACAVGIYVVVIDPPLKIAMACAAGIMGTLAAIKVGEACYNYCIETNTQEGLELVGDGIHLHQD
ncbi:hypothetical protein RMONA_03185 [Rickettsia monacensis]|uniref:Uncharacterized protein n=1 Tax=Rickettsia monacensis TaxID=109232 RepID=A0A0B7J253_9RICK|nr:hypothetical protein [Rickettsia monacensis]CDI29226.1 hypothetical protein RMONA_2800 [Rickettsia monacensis IrR/Munich]CEO17035.1 hypothetical protein RMONA_03185 [Rickettsia monacensis]